MRDIVSPLEGIHSPFGRKAEAPTPPPSGVNLLLLANGTDKLKQTDNTSFIKLTYST